MLKRRGIAIAVLAVAPGFARAAGTEVHIDNFTFAPAALTVPAGTVVTWVNRDDIPHTVVDRDRPREVRSTVLDTDDRYSRTFAAPGRFGYFCSLHPHMQGTVVVT